MNPAKPIWRIAAALLIACLGACGGTRTIVVPVGEPVIIREPIAGPVPVLVQRDGEWVESTTDRIPAGWAAWYIDRSDLHGGE